MIITHIILIAITLYILVSIAVDLMIATKKKPSIYKQRVCRNAPELFYFSTEVKKAIEHYEQIQKNAREI